MCLHYITALAKKCFKHELENTYSPSTLEAKLFFSCFAFWLAILHFHLEFDDTCQTSPSPGLILNKTFDLISLCLLYPFLTVLQTVLYYAQVNISFFVSPLSRHAVLFFKVGCQENLWLDGMPFSRNELNLWNLWITFYICMISFFFHVCSVVLFPVAVTFFITWWFIQFVDGFFSPLYAKLGIDIFGNCCTHTSELAVYGDSKFTERLYLDLLHILEDILLTCHPYS